MSARWQERANCAGVDPTIFFPERGVSCAEAKAVCRACEVRAECLEFGMAEKSGIWGGLSDHRHMRRPLSLECADLTT